MAGTEGSPAEKAGFIIGPAKEEPIKSIRWRLWFSSPTPPARAATSRSRRPAAISSSSPTTPPRAGPTCSYTRSRLPPMRCRSRQASRCCAPLCSAPDCCGNGVRASPDSAARTGGPASRRHHHREVAGRLRELARPLRRVLERFASDSPLEEGEFELRSLSGPIYASGPDPNLADGSHWTRRWSKRDSNPQSPATRRGQAPRRQIFRKRHGATG